MRKVTAVLHSLLVSIRWAVLFSHPQDFTPVCTTELADVVNKLPEFEKRCVRILCLSCDPLEDHHIWAKVVAGWGGVVG